MTNSWKLPDPQLLVHELAKVLRVGAEASLLVDQNLEVLLNLKSVAVRANTDSDIDRAESGHLKLPVGGHEGPSLRTPEFQVGGQQISRSRP